MSWTAPNSHPDLDTIADLVEGGLLDETDTAAVTTHLAGCVECAETRNALLGVQDLLTGQPPEPMPDEIAVRMDTALAGLTDSDAVSVAVSEISSAASAEASSEAALGAVSGVASEAAISTVSNGLPPGPVQPPLKEPPSEEPPSEEPAPVVSLHAARQRRNRRRLRVGLLVAAAVAGLALALPPMLLDSPSRSAANKELSGSPSAAQSDVLLPFSGSQETPIHTAAPQAAGDNQASPPSSFKAGTPAEPSAPSGFLTDQSTATGMAYTDSQLTTQVDQLLATRDLAEFSGAPVLAAPRPAAVVPPCAVPASGSTEALAVDRGTYDGKNAYVVILPTQEAKQVRAVITDADTCSPKALKDTTISR